MNVRPGDRRPTDALLGRELDRLVRLGVLRDWRPVRNRGGYRRFALTFPDGQSMTEGPGIVYGVILGALYAQGAPR